jgi:hypothetical protein
MNAKEKAKYQENLKKMKNKKWKLDYYSLRMI